MDESIPVSLGQRLDLRSRELIALVGGGGKSTLLFWLGAELAGQGKHVVLTTTTKMGRDQITGNVSVCPTIECAATPVGGPVMLVTGGDSHKITGPHPKQLDALFAGGSVDYLIVEADGAHGRPLKAPALHEPVVPDTSTMVVIAVGVDAVGMQLGDAAHRIEQAVEFSGLAVDHVLTSADCATILMHPRGALRTVPAGARVIVAVTKVDARNRSDAENLARVLTAHEPVDGVVLVEDR